MIKKLFLVASMMISNIIISTPREDLSPPLLAKSKKFTAEQWLTASEGTLHDLKDLIISSEGDETLKKMQLTEIRNILGKISDLRSFHKLMKVEIFMKPTDCEKPKKVVNRVKAVLNCLITQR